MSETNDNGQAVENEKEKRDELPLKLYATREEAMAAVPANPPKNTRPFLITKGEATLGWILAIGYDPAISRAAQIDGYKASSGKRSAPITKETIGTYLANLSEDERMALLAQYMPTTPAPEPAPTKAKGKGK